MKKPLFIPLMTAGVLSAVSVPNVFASPELQATLTSLCLDPAEHYTREGNDAMHFGRAWANRFANGADTSGSIWFQRPYLLYTGFRGTEIDGRGDLNGTVFTPTIGFQFQSLAGIRLGASYMHSQYDYEAYDGDIEGDGCAGRVNLFASKELCYGFYLGGSFTYGEGDFELSDRNFNVKGSQDWSFYGGSVALGYGTQFGEAATPGNLSFDTSANFHWAHKDADQENGSFEDDYTYCTVDFEWRNRLSYNITPGLNFYIGGDLITRLDETDRDDINLPFGSPHRSDDTYGELLAGFNYDLIRNFSINAEVQRAVGNRDINGIGGRFLVAYNF
jgi:hypothetical protein